MEQWTNDIIKFLLNSEKVWIYIILFLSAITENLFPPIPGDTVTAFGAFLVGTGRLSFFLVYLSTTAGSLIGFMGLFFIGRMFRKEYFIKKNFRFFPAERIESSELWFRKYGYAVVLINRFLPGIRSVISISAGISRLNPAKVLALSLLSASFWNLIWIAGGFYLGTNWDIFKEKAAHLLKNYNIAIGIILLCLLLIYFIKKFLKKRKDTGNQNRPPSA